MPSSRPRRADALRNRAGILQAAQDLFAESGVTVPLDDIARRAGVGAGTVYRHFPTKEALFEVVVARRWQSIIQSAADAVGADPSHDALLVFLRHLLNQIAPNKDLVDALDWAKVARSPVLAEIVFNIQAHIDRLLHHSQRVGDVRSDVDTADVMFLAHALILATQRAGEPMPDAGLTAMPKALRVVWDGLRTKR